MQQLQLLSLQVLGSRDQLGLWGERGTAALHAWSDAGCTIAFAQGVRQLRAVIKGYGWYTYCGLSSDLLWPRPASVSGGVTACVPAAPPSLLPWQKVC